MRLSQRYHLTEVADRLDELYREPRAVARAGVEDLRPELEALAVVAEIDEQTRINLLVKAARLLRADTFRVDSAREALEQLQGAYGGTVGQPAIGPALPVRFPAEVHEAIAAIALSEGIVNAAGEPRRAATVRRLVREALEARGALPSEG